MNTRNFLLLTLLSLSHFSEAVRSPDAGPRAARRHIAHAARQAALGDIGRADRAAPRNLNPRQRRIRQGNLQAAIALEEMFEQLGNHEIREPGPEEFNALELLQAQNDAAVAAGAGEAAPPVPGQVIEIEIPVEGIQAPLENEVIR